MATNLFSWWSGRDHGSKLAESIGGGGEQSVALVVGVTGIVGSALAEILPRSDTPGGPWKVYGVARRAQPDWFVNSGVEYVQCDVLNEEETRAKIAPLKDVTHVFWVVWVSRSTEEENIVDNGKMLHNVLESLLPNAPNLQHICLQTGGKHYVGPFRRSSDSNIPFPTPPFREDMPRLPLPNFYYTLEDIVFDAVKRKEGLTWSVHRPSHIFGFSPWSLMNVVGSLAVYAAICKHEGSPFRFPGNRVSWEDFADASDACLIAEQEIWACLEPRAKNKAFNTTNGDVFTFKRLWSLLAEKFELEVPPYDGERVSMVEWMKGKDVVWDAIVAKHGLIPTKLEEVGTWWFLDIILNMPRSFASSMNRSKELGFMGFRNTETSLMYWVDKMTAKQIIP